MRGVLGNDYLVGGEMKYFRSRADYIARLTTYLAGEILTGDILSAQQNEVAEARRMLDRAGIRLPGDPVPDWHKKRKSARY